ncbi:Protein mak16 [Astathelohania contejeani]|uniref:Protein MAK16 n=1 Tax=Astathelohania contejeani TaxID=164912 RepID=A0ABQ7I2M9_9MICR|nr:Protein mak16 [Thelohania contejeani]
MDDKKTWNLIGGKKNFCSFKMVTDTDILCKNKYNVTALCNEFSCPLSNSKYATVREHDQKLYLYIKEPERINTPNKTYEEIELSSDYNRALKEIDENLEFFNEELIHKCKQRLTKLTQYLERIKELEKNGAKTYTARKTKNMRLERLRAMKAVRQIDFEKNIEEELVTRLESGLYGKALQDTLWLAGKEKSQKLEVEKQEAKPKEKEVKKRKTKKDRNISEKKMKFIPDFESIGKTENKKKVRFVADFEESDNNSQIKNKKAKQLEW